MPAKQRDNSGVCPLCSREVPLTFHHLIPRKLHRRGYFRKNYTRDELNRGVHVCRLCHDGIHDRYDEMELARTFTSLQSLLDDESLRRHFEWVARQKVREP